jgi:hypothetical protein
MRKLGGFLRILRSVVIHDRPGEIEVNALEKFCDSFYPEYLKTPHTDDLLTFWQGLVRCLIAGEKLQLRILVLRENPSESRLQDVDFLLWCAQ